MNDLIAGLIPGLSAMANVHPLLVHFPIALLCGFVLADALAMLTQTASLRQAASWMLYFGTVAAAGTVATGLQAADTVEHDEVVHAIMESHQGYGIAVLSVAALLSVWRWLVRARFSRFGHALHFGGGLLLVVLVTRGADLGGTMVYRHGVAVARPAGPMATEPSEPTPGAAVGEAAPSGGGAQSMPNAAVEPLPAVNADQHRHTHSHRHSHKHPH